MYANSADPDQTSRPSASDLGLHSLPLSHKRDARLIWVKTLHTTIPHDKLKFKRNKLSISIFFIKMEMIVLIMLFWVTPKHILLKPNLKWP